ncbi:hypothetical protein KL86PLE_60371 [uncultured Pleomorphomonas sp.]|uniref:Uncharacterized protein n=1 Tax=uncultured Pleomorphomonas sp. TaxID=442121 RepID=A0A212LL08_9HYPH|nr:hypothetical protein KL86PLE_60371 [uncultured Pleomorphomonas sp.]
MLSKQQGLPRQAAVTEVALSRSSTDLSHLDIGERHSGMKKRLDDHPTSENEVARDLSSCRGS